MSETHFLSASDDLQIVEAIRIAEQNTSGEIRIHFSKSIKTDVLNDAKMIFEKLKMHQTKARNGVLIFMVLSEKQFCIIGDEGIHNIAHDEFWQSARDLMQTEFKNGDILNGILKGIKKVSEILKKDFPYLSNDSNELSNDISKDE